MGKLLIAGFMGGVIVIECLLAYLFIPSAEDVAALAEQNMAKKLPASLGAEGPAEDKQNHKEVELGQYDITMTPGNSGVALRVNMTIVGAVAEEDASKFQAVYDRNLGRFRQLVLQEVRNSEIEDLRDPMLGLIKRRILEKSNDLFGKPFLKSIIFSQFSYIEQ